MKYQPNFQFHGLPGSGRKIQVMFGVSNSTSFGADGGFIIIKTKI